MENRGVHSVWMRVLPFLDRHQVNGVGRFRGCDRSLGGPWSLKVPLGGRGSRRAEGTVDSPDRAGAGWSQVGRRAVGGSQRVLPLYSSPTEFLHAVAGFVLSPVMTTLRRERILVPESIDSRSS